MRFMQLYKMEQQTFQQGFPKLQVSDFLVLLLSEMQDKIKVYWSTYWQLRYDFCIDNTNAVYCTVKLGVQVVRKSKKIKTIKGLINDVGLKISSTFPSLQQVHVAYIFQSASALEKDKVECL